MKLIKLYGGKSPKRKLVSKPLLVVLMVVLLLAITIGGALAWLAATGGNKVNTFTPAHVTSKVVEDFGSKKTIKKDVKIKNTGDIPAYIRVAIVPTWQNDDGSIAPIAASLNDLNISFDMTGWIVIGDYYYYTKAVAPAGYTGILINSATVATANEHKMNLQILCEAVQADPADAVEGVWPVLVGTDGTLSAS